jgi:hypothetical protein
MEVIDMLDGNIFAVYTTDIKEIGLCAIPVKIPRCNNLVGYMRDFKCKTFNVCNTWKDAQKLAEQWNQDFKNNGKRRL